MWVLLIRTHSKCQTLLETTETTKRNHPKDTKENSEHLPSLNSKRCPTMEGATRLSSVTQASITITSYPLRTQATEGGLPKLPPSPRHSSSRSEEEPNLPFTT